MLPEYLQHWGVQRAPFALTPDPEMLFMSSQHRECLLRLKYAVVSGKGGALLVSENAGDGKTSVLRRLCNDLDREFEGRCRTAFISHPTMEPTEMIQEISRQLGGATPQGTKTDALSALGERLEYLYHQGEKVVVIVDEGQMLAHRPDVLQELRILLNFCVADAFLLTFLFSGQAPLEPAVRGMPEFWQRLPVRYFLRNLDAQDTADVLHHRLEVAGREEEVFDVDACKLLHRYSDGCPRVICSIADLCLVIGHSQRANVIGADIVQSAAVDMGLIEGDRAGGFHYFHFVRGELQGDGGDESRDVRARRRRRMAEADAARSRAEASGAGGATVPTPHAPAARKPVPVPAPAPPPDPEGLITCPCCRRHSAPDQDACVVCGRALGVPCPLCKSAQRVDARRCRSCGESLPETSEVALARELDAALATAGFRGGVPAGSGGRMRFDRLPGEEVLHLLRPRLTLDVVHEGRVRQTAGPGKATLAVTNRGLALLLPRSYVRLGYDSRDLNVSTHPLADSPTACGVAVRRGETAYMLRHGARDLAGLAGALQDWVVGKQATLASRRGEPAGASP